MTGDRTNRGNRAGRPVRGAPKDGVAKDRRAAAADRDERLYLRKRANLRRRRARLDHESFDPAPPRDEDWTVEDDQTDGVVKITAPTPVGDTLRSLVSRRGWDERLRGASAWSRWEEIVGPDLAARCEPVRLVSGTLTVRAENQVWATQLRYMLPHLRANAESVLGAGTVREVTVVVGRLQGRDVELPGSSGTPDSTDLTREHLRRRDDA